MLTGISTSCFYPEYTELALRRLADARVAAAEVFFNCTYELEPGYIRELKKIADSGGVKVLSVHPYECAMDPMMFFSSYDRRFEEGLDIYRRYFAAANALGAGFVVFHGGSRHFEMERGLYFERFGRLLEAAEKEGSEICHENVSRSTGYCPGFFLELKKALPKARFVLDLKQALRAGQDIGEMARAMGNRLRHVHFSDSDGGNVCLPPGRGTFNIAQFIADIAEIGYGGGLIVELYRENYVDFVELFDSYQLLSTVVSTVRKNAEPVDSIRQSG